jgi:hypothetical protein
LTEGLSIRAVARLFDVERNTVGRLALRVGQNCERLHDRMMLDLQGNLIQLDKQWDYVAKKQKRVRSDDPAEYGDTWLYIALSATHKAVLSYVAGKRSVENTEALALDLRGRILWSVGELINAANEPSDVPPIPRKVQSTLLPGTRRFRLIVGRGGKGTTSRVDSPYHRD